jgi:hypothetical protein
MQPIVTSLLTWGCLLGMPVVLGWLARHMRNASLAQTLDAAAGRAGGIAYAYLQSQAAIGGTPSMNIAIDQGVDHLRQSMPQVISTLGVIGPVLTNMVKGELGKLLAQDPNVSVGPAVRK